MTKTLEGSSIAIVGLGNSQMYYTSSVANGKEYDEVWVINSMIGPLKHNRAFMMDPPSRFLDSTKAGAQTSVMRKELPRHPGPIYTCELDDRVPGAILYPLEEVVKDTGLCYFNNTVPYALAFAAYQKVGKLYLYGIDYSYSKNVLFAEAGRSCTEFWLAFCISVGMEIEVASTSTLLDTNVPPQQRLYGYHRLKDPLISTIENGSLLVTKQSKWEPPEEESPEGVLNRNDKIISLQEAV
jgi:hypothetical protein